MVAYAKLFGSYELLCVNPVYNLDKDSAKYVSKMIDFIGQTRALIIVTHNLTITENMDRIITMDKGKIISDINKNKNQNKNQNKY